MVARNRIALAVAFQALGAVGIASLPTVGRAAGGYQVFVTNEKSNDVTVIDGADFHVAGTIPVGKRPRGIHVAPDGKTVYVAVSGTPVSGPPELDAHGNPILKKNSGNDDDDADKAADGIAVLDVAAKKLTRKISAGSDPEEFALSKDATRLYISNEDTRSASVVNVATSKLEHIIPVSQEPEGVTTTRDGKFFYVTCEAGGDVFVIDTSSYASVAHFKVEGRPRSVAFLADADIGFVPSESVGQVNVIDTAQHKVLKVLDLPPGSRPMRVRVAPNGQKIYVSNGRAGTISVIDAHSYELLDTIKVGTRPWGIAISPDGKTLYSANGPSNDVSVVDLAAGKEIARVKAGSSPWGVVIVPIPL
jgi:YVTN family beta-propeller protein